MSNPCGRASAPVRVGVDLPQTFGAAPVDARGVRDRAVQAEELGFDGVWVSEDLLTEAGTLDALTTLAHVAAITHHVDLGAAVLLAPLYSPVLLAKRSATLDQLSGGRLVLGLGLGGDPGVYPAFGLPSTARGRRFDRVVEGLHALWSGSEAPTEGPPFDLRGRRMQPCPVQDPPRLWFGGRSRGALLRALRYGNGFIGAGTSTSAAFAELVQQLRSLGEPTLPSGFTIAKRVYVGCDEHVPGASARLRDWLGRRYRRALPDGVAVAGDVGECQAGLRRLADDGANYLIVSFVENHENAYAAAARDFLPTLHTGFS